MGGVHDKMTYSVFSSSLDDTVQANLDRPELPPPRDTPLPEEVERIPAGRFEDESFVLEGLLINGKLLAAEGAKVTAVVGIAIDSLSHSLKRRLTVINPPKQNTLFCTLESALRPPSGLGCLGWLYRSPLLFVGFTCLVA